MLGMQTYGGRLLRDAELVADDADPMLGILQRRAGPVAGEHVVRAALVGRLAVRHRAADGDLVGDLRRSASGTR